MDAQITFTLNGGSRSVTTDPRRPLLEVLREDLGLTGTKYGCGEGECRACTVLLNGESTPSCLTPIRSVDGKTVVTSEVAGNFPNSPVSLEHRFGLAGGKITSLDIGLARTGA